MQPNPKGVLQVLPVHHAGPESSRRFAAPPSPPFHSGTARRASARRQRAVMLESCLVRRRVFPWFNRQGPYLRDRWLDDPPMIRFTFQRTATIAAKPCYFAHTALASSVAIGRSNLSACSRSLAARIRGKR